MKAKKLWYKGYSINGEIEDYIAGEEYLLDLKIAKYDCIASIAHAKMLARIGILTPKEASMLGSSLNTIIKLLEQGKFEISKEDEDCHTAIENYLTKNLGQLGKKIHTGRSRNDQVLVALRLYSRENLTACISLAKKLTAAMLHFKGKYGSIELPGYTHTRKAMPSSVRLWTDAFIDAINDDISLLEATLMLINQSPLGTGAGYGSPIKLDREYTAKELGFPRIQVNPIYAQLSRGKFEATILHALSQVMLDLNRISAELIVFTMPEFGYYELPREFTTGSSMMPNKRNPDFLELMRAKYHIILGYEFQVQSLLANLPTGYNADLSLTKAPLIKGFEITSASLKIAALLFKNLRVNRQNCAKAMSDELYATSRAYDLVTKGVPFRDAYKKIADEYGKNV